MSITEENRRELNDALAALFEDELPPEISGDAEVLPVGESAPPPRDEKCPIDGSTLVVVESTKDFEEGRVCLKCPEKGCVTFTTTENAKVVLEGVARTDPELRKVWFALKCNFDRRPFLKLSRSAKNPNRLFLTCARKRDQDPCRYFQWVDSPPFCPRKEAVPLGGGDEWSRLTRDQRKWLLDEANIDTSGADGRWKEFRRNVAQRIIRKKQGEPYPSGGMPRSIHSFSRCQQLVD